MFCKVCKYPQSGNVLTNTHPAVSWWPKVELKMFCPREMVGRNDDSGSDPGS